MKKNVIAVIAACAVFAAVYFGVKFIDEYYVGVPVDAVYSEEYSPDAAPDDYAPDWYHPAGSVEIDGRNCGIYAFFGENGRVEQRVFVRKDTIATSGFRGSSTVTDTQLGFVRIPTSTLEYKQLSAEEVLAAVSADNFFEGGSDPIAPYSAEPAELYQSDEDVAYRIVGIHGEGEISEDGIISIGGEDSRKYYRFCKVNGREYGMFFPCGSSGEVADGTLPSNDLVWRCKLVWDGTDIPAEPVTQAEKDAKEELVTDRRQRRLDAEYRAKKEAEERAARLKAEREAREKAEREAAERAAAERAAKEAAIREAIANMTEEERAQLKEKYSAVSMYLEKNLDKYIIYGMYNENESPRAAVQAINTGIDKPFYTEMQPADLSKGFLVLVNKYHYLDSGYVPNLSAIPGGYGSGYLQSTACTAFVQMVDAARAEGINLRSVSPYRSYGTQSSLYNSYVRSMGQRAADRTSARPGSSEHQLGLAVDINTADSSSHFENTPEYAWLLDNCWKYGFIIRYRQGREYITGYEFEPWHYRYVGGPAESIMKSGLTYEEYYAVYIDK